jgi:hypothetical protein
MSLQLQAAAVQEYQQEARDRSLKHGETPDTTEDQAKSDEHADEQEKLQSNTINDCQLNKTDELDDEKHEISIAEDCLR